VGSGDHRRTRAVLLVHGFGDTPQTLRALAAYLHAAGYDVRVPLLPGHGRSLAAFDASRHEEWIACVTEELATLRGTYDWVGLGGLSMGGALAAIVASRTPDLPVLTLLAPYVGMPRYLRIAARLAPWWSRWVGPISADSPDSIHDPAEREKSLAYGSVTGHALHELAAVARLGWQALPAITAPTLIVQSKHDNRVAAHVARRAYARLGAPRKRLLLTDVGGHVLTVDVGKEAVFDAVRVWLEGGPGTDSSSPDTRSVQTSTASAIGDRAVT
jgi:carboxylesterase